MKPHHYFELHRADEVAECWEGLLRDKKNKSKK